MNIAFDGSGLFIAPFTGVGNYVHQLLTHLLQLEGGDSYRLLSHRAPAAGYALNGHGRASWVPTHFPNRLLWTQCVLPFTLRALRPAVAHFPNFVGPLLSDQNVVITVHDLGLLNTPALYTRRQRMLMRPLIVPSARRARAVIVVSEQSRRELVQLLDLPSSKVHVVHEAAAPFFRETLAAGECERRLAPYGWSRADRHLLYVGTLEPRKNLARLVAALHRLHRRGLRAHLWLVGQPGWRFADLLQCIHTLGLQDFVHQTGYVSALDLRAFYHGCDVFVMPSLKEGFGLPVVEAMASGAPVVVSDTPVMRETAGSAALYFEPTDDHALAEILSSCLTDEALSRDLRSRGGVRAQHFSWERAARETLAVYRHCLTEPLPAVNA